MSYMRYGHADKLFVKVGDKVKKGQKIGTIGKGGPNNFSAHLHFDLPKNKLANWTSYVIGKSKDWVMENYEDPEQYKKTILPNFTHKGLGYLEFWQYPGGPAYHPGDDLNSGTGDSDLGHPFYSATDGTVIYAYDGTGSNNGWGKLLVIEPLINQEEPMNKDFVEAIEKLVRKDYGNNLNEKDQKDATKRLKEVKQKIDGLLENNEVLSTKLSNQETILKGHIAKAETCEQELKTCKENLRMQTEKANNVKNALTIGDVVGILWSKIKGVKIEK